MSSKPASGMIVVAHALLVALLVSCSSVPPTNYYVLGLPEHSNPVVNRDTLAGTIVIAPFESETTYLRKKILWRSGPNRLGYYSYERWASLPAEMVSYRLYRRMQSSGMFENVILDGSSEQADLILKGKIRAFEEVNTPEGSDGRVEVEVELVRADGTTLWTGVENHSEPAARQDVEAVVRAIADATEATVTEILKSVEESLLSAKRTESVSQ